MGSAPPGHWKSLCITHLATCPNQNSPTDSADEAPKERYTTSTIPDENGSSKLALEPFNERPTEKEFLPAPGFRITENRTG